MASWSDPCVFVCLEQAGEQGKLLFDAYPRLKQINRARKNLEKTLTEVRSVLQHRGVCICQCVVRIGQARGSGGC